MNTALTVSQQQLTPDIWTMINAVAPVMKESRLFGVATESQAKAIMAKGYELGMSLTAAFEFITVIQDKPALIPRGALALIYHCGQLEGIKIDDDGNTCTVHMKRRNGVEFTASFSMDDAKAAGLVKSGSGWEKYPRQMRQWRAIGFAADFVFPDILGGLKRADELGADLTVDGEVIDGSWNQKPVPSTGSYERERVQAVDNLESGKAARELGSQTAKAEQPQRDPATWLNELVQKHGAEDVMVANEGKIPGTLEELTAVEEKLKAGSNE